MAKVTSSKYPELQLPALGVRFRDGVAEVDDPKVLDALAKFEGVQVPEDAKPKRAQHRGKKSD